MNAYLYAAQDRAQELRAEAGRAREARAARNQSKRPTLLQLIKILVLARQPRLT
ncbi:hypothetical protein DAETH_04760 [Deinococcus aetherius]|uniref:Uncharacterized protein n=1 Tax=Deinococcus aetherius TaxID=200252 RepID=A0ABM8AAA6_9DEIO|nr:hypothetical protein [Deinococcus aetherius]BDP40507.1 hypothetical protein DAETH_04760 [Deinococcus aetherius]